jgi:hypothetical protein
MIVTAPTTMIVTSQFLMTNNVEVEPNTAPATLLADDAVESTFRAPNSACVQNVREIRMKSTFRVPKSACVQNVRVIRVNSTFRSPKSA